MRSRLSYENKSLGAVGVARDVRCELHLAEVTFRKIRSRDYQVLMNFKRSRRIEVETKT